jgi:hypothetical protein
MRGPVWKRRRGAWLRGALGRRGGWTRRHLGLTLLLSVGAFVFGWLWNTYIMAVSLQGSLTRLVYAFSDLGKRY